MEFHRPIVMGARGMAATGHPLASDAALDVLKNSGNVVAAALCAAAVVSVVKSYHCGLGGDVFGIFYSAKARRIFVPNASGRSPRSMRCELYSDGTPHRGILAACTPGTLVGWFEAAAKLGSRSLADLLKPAIDYAENGFPVFPHLANVIRSSYKTLAAEPAWAEIFLPGGKAPEFGDLLFPKDLAAVLAGGANGGRSAFYDDIAKSIVQKSEPCSGVFTSDDFVDHQSRWEEPLCANYRDFEIYVPPANSHGLLLLWLKILADYDLAKYGHNSPEWRCR